MNKKAETKVKTVILPGDRGPEIQYRLTAFNQASKKKNFQTPKKIQNSQIKSKNITTNVIHVTSENNSNSKEAAEDQTTKQASEVTTAPLSNMEETKISTLDDYKSNLSTEFCCAIEKDCTGSWIAGIEFVQDGNIIILDTNNCKLKRFNTLFKFVSEIEVPMDCASMTKISDKEIAVTCLNEIHFYSIGHFGMSRSSKHFEVKGHAYGISYEDSRYAVTCDVEGDANCAIRILDVFGDEIHEINPKGGVDGDIAIGTYCQIDATNRVVAVSDFDNRHVLCYNFNGSLKWRCEIEGGPRGLLKIGKEFFVSDNYGQEICAISIDSGTKRTVLHEEDGVFNPEFISCNHRDTKLAITQRAFDTISVFNLNKK